MGEAPCFLLNGASYLAVLWALAGMRLRRRGGAPSRDVGGRGLRSGLRYVRAQPTQAALLLALGLGLGARRSRRTSSCRRWRSAPSGAAPTGYGLLLTAYGVGAVALGAPARVAALHAAPSTGGRCSLGLRSVRGGAARRRRQPVFALAVACQLVAGLGMIRFTATTNTLIQLLVDDAYRGRVMGLHTVMFMGVAPLGSLLLGAIAQPFGAARGDPGLGGGAARWPWPSS